MAPAGLILTIALKVFLLREDTDTTVIMTNNTGEYGFTAVQCASTPVGLDGALKMEVIEPRPSQTSAYNVHLKYESVTGDVLYLKVDNTTNKVFLDKERSAVPPFKAETMPVDKDKHIFVFSAINAAHLQMKVKKTSTLLLDCAQKGDASSPADAVRYIDSQELYMIPASGGILTHRHIVGYLLEC